MPHRFMGLIADIGGTNARFALCSDEGEILSPLTLLCRDFPSLELAVKAYLEKIEYRGPAIKRAAFAVACPVLGDRISMTNSDWSFSVSEVKSVLDLDSLDVVNDFVAQALAVPLLKESEKLKIGQGEATKGFPIVVVGPGTGLGVSILVPQPDGQWIAVASEGGHATMPAPYPEEERVIAALRQEYGHVSAERVVSGMGLTNLYKTLLVLHGREGLSLEPQDISRRALEGDDLCREAVQMMFGLLGTLAGNLALTAGALGGVYIAGGIIPRDGLLEMFMESSFRVRFEAKGRFASYLSRIPTYVMISDYPAFLGLSGLVRKNVNK
ncbi:MAG: glucokinase [Alphaproteobacteria bacterium]|nr:glucokinase [Alphaproteobacteria bacterium]